MGYSIRDNYLKNMYLLSGPNGDISMSDLGERMRVSTPTVNSMVKRLKEEGLVEYEKYRPLRLTVLGRESAVRVLRRHRIAEVFLLKVMGFSWEEVHDIAEELEHITSDAFFDRMDDMSGHPDRDPHGSPIPDKDGTVLPNEYQKLSDMSPGDEVYLRALLNSTNELLVFLNKQGIALETRIRISSVESFDGSMIVSYKGHRRVVLTREVCERLLVE